jgi:hypothetical protein
VRLSHSKLLHRPCTGNQDIHQPPCVLLPVGAGRDVGDANDSPKEIHWVKILAYVAALDRALHERANCFMNLWIGPFEHLLGVANKRVQHGSDDLLRFDRVNEQQQPGAQGLLRRLVSGVRGELASFREDVQLDPRPLVATVPWAET